MRGNTVTLHLKKSSVATAGRLFQYDYGQRLILADVELPEIYEVHFSNCETGESKTMIGNATGVDIPDEYLLSGDNVYVWLYLHDGENDGETEYKGIIYVTKRAKPTDQKPTPVQQSAMDQAIAAFNAGVERVETLEEEWTEIVEEVVPQMQEDIDSKADKRDTVLETTLSRGRKAGTTAGVGSFAFGSTVIASAQYSHAEGNVTEASGIASHAEGSLTVASGQMSHAEGGQTVASGNGSHAEGAVTQAIGTASHAEGKFTISKGNSQHVQGKYNVEDANNVYADIVGNGTDDNNRSNASALDWNGNLKLAGDVYVGANPDSTGGEKLAKESDLTNKADKRDTVLETTLSKGRKAETTVGAGSFAFGEDVEASGMSAHAEGNNTAAKGYASHAEGMTTTANGYVSHAEGVSTVASGISSHAEGRFGIASGAYSHVEGGYNSSNLISTASGDSSHAEGSGTTASGRSSHAEGIRSIASGAGSHAEGRSTANDGLSHAEGRTIANGEYSHTQGKFNVEDTNNVYADIVGNGSDENARSNAFALTWSGNGKYAGDVYVHANPDSSGGDKLATEDYVDDAISQINTMSIHICTAQEYDAQTGIPTIANPDASTFYLVPGGDAPNLYIEWVYVNNAWEKFGSATIDLSNYVQKTDYASSAAAGVVKVLPGSGITVADGSLYTAYANSNAIKTGTDKFKPIVPYTEHQAAFYGLAKAAGDDTQAQSDNEVGQYTDEAKTAIQTMLDVPAKADIPDLSVLDDKAPVIINTASGAIASFNDGAEDMPVKSLTVQIEPVQDLHGYDSPWPAGGGKNKFDKDRLSDISEYKTLANGYYYTDPITLLPNTTYIMVPTSTENVGTDAYYVLYKNPDASDPDYLVITNPVVQYPVAAGVPTAIQFTTGATGVVRFGVVYSQSTSGPDQQALQAFMTVDYQIEEGSAATAWTPYSNECPISGRTGANVYGAGKNLVPTIGSDRTNANVEYTVNSDGSVTAVGLANATSWWKIADASLSNFIYIPAGTYKLSGGKSSDEVLYLIGQYVDGESIGNSTVTGGVYDTGSGLTFTLLKDAYINYQIQISSGHTVDETFYPMIRNADDTDTTWKPCASTTLPITFPSEAGTVYGGFLTINEDGTGQIVVNNGISDMGNLAWAKNTTSSGQDYYFSATIANIMRNSPTSLCSIYKISNVSPSALHDFEISFRGGNGRSCFVKDSRYTEVTDFKANMSGAQLIYELAEPIVYNLTALEVLETLKGVNNVWSDTGAVEVTYRADTKQYVDNAAPEIPVQDVQVNGASIVQNGVANVPIGNDQGRLGVIKIVQGNQASGLTIDGYGNLFVALATSSSAKGGTNIRAPIVPSNQHEATFYGLAKAAGSDEKNSSLPLGQYTDSAKAAIQHMLGTDTNLAPYESDTTSDIQYAIGEVFMLNGKLHRATAAIEIGDMLIEGTNCEIVNVADIFTRDVQVNGTSVVQNGVANVPVANANTYGVVRTYDLYGSQIINGSIGIAPAVDRNYKEKSGTYKAVVGENVHRAVFWGLANAAGDTTQSQSNNAVGTYTDEAKAAIKTMLGVPDIQVNGTSIVQNGVANVPIAGTNRLGVVKPNGYGIGVEENGNLYILRPSDVEIRAGDNQFRVLNPNIQHASAFYGLAKAAGADMASLLNATVGVYPEAQKSAISTMLNGSVAVSGSTPTITALPGVRYVCGEVSTIDITTPESGVVDIVFTSGSTPAVLTVTPPTGMTMKWANGFDPTALEANTTYEINIMDGCLGVAGTWT